MAQWGMKFADLCRDLASDTYEAVVVLVTLDLECLHFSGPTERYFQAEPVGPSLDLIALVHPAIEGRLRQAIRQAIEEDRRVVVSALQLPHSSQKFSIDVLPTFYDGDKLFLVCFTDEHHPVPQPSENSPGSLDATPPAQVPAVPREEPRSDDMQKSFGALSLDATDLSNMNPLLASEGPPPVENELPLSGAVDALKDQLRAAREREQVTSNDLENWFQFMGMEAIFLDAHLHVRFITPATKSQLGATPEDIGRPFSDLELAKSDAELISDVLTVLQQHTPVERQITRADRRWFTRRVFPYRARAGAAEGVVIAFVDITEQKLAVESVKEAKGQARSANEMRSRSLAAVSYYLREPLHSLALLQGLLEKKFEGDAAHRMAAMLDQALSTMSGMLNTLVDVEQLDAGTVQVEAKEFPISELLSRLGDDFASHAIVQGLNFRVIACSLFVRSDRRLLEQTLRTLLINSLKNTIRGKVLLGCRRRGAVLSIEIFDTGLGIPEGQLQPLLAEDPLDGILDERSRGMGLTLAKRLCGVLGHRLTVASSLGKGTAFAVEVPLLASSAHAPKVPWKRAAPIAADEDRQRTGTILVIEDDPKGYELLELLLKEEGHTVMTARDDIGALAMVARGSIRPDLIVADYRLLHPADKLHTKTKLEEMFLDRVPVIVLVGDISRDGVSEIAFRNCVPLKKPVRAAELTQVIRRLLLLQKPAHEPDVDDAVARGGLAKDPLSLLTERQRQIMQLVLAGYPSKNIAADLGISRRTVENHRATIMRKTGAKSLPELARMELARSLKNQNQN